MESINTGALVLALLAKADKTGTVLQQVLMDLEQEYMAQRRDFEGYLELCEVTLLRLAGYPILEATLTLAKLNGMRRIPNVDPSEVFTLADEMSEKLKKLPRNTPPEEVNALHARFAYNMGVFSRDVGEFKRAAEYQEQAEGAYVALGDNVRTAISGFLVGVEEFNHQLQEGGDAIQEALDAVDDAYTHHKSVLWGVGWWWANLPIHVMMAHAQAGEFDSPVFTECLNFVLCLGEKYAHWVRFAKALDAYLREDREGARALFEEIADHPERDRQGDLTVTATLMLGRILAPVDELLATGRYSRAARWSGLKGRQAKAVALRELDRLLAPLQQGP